MHPVSSPSDSFALVGATVLLPDGLCRSDVSIHDGRIENGSAARRVDARGLLLLPGIVDAHGDGFERHLAPRRGALRSPADGLRALEVELAANGITTACLAQFWSWEGGMRAPDFAQTLAGALAEFDGALDMRMQLRLEVACHSDLDAVLAFVARYGIDFLILNDHLPHAALAAGKRPPRLDGQAFRARRSPADHLSLMQRLHADMPGAGERLAVLPGSLHLGSHDDASPEARARNRALGATIAEFPVTLETARAAREAGDAIVLGAPNVVRGGSHDRGVNARALIGEGLCDALASDYHYPALHQAAFALADAGLSLAEAWALVSSSPARMLGLTDRGQIAPGQRADIVVMEEDTRRIVGTVAAGRIVHASGAFAARLLAA